LIVVWSDGNIEAVEVSDKYLREFIYTKAYLKWDKFILPLATNYGALNMEYARKIYLED